MSSTVAGTVPQVSEFDVVVVGSGAGALTGAYVAAARDRSVVVLEATDRLGGTSAYSGAACWLPGTQVQERAGIGDSTEAARIYLRALIGEQTAAHQDAFLQHAPALVEFLERDPAIAFEWRPFPDYFAAPGRMDSGRAINPLDLPTEDLGELAALVRPPVDRDRTGQGHSAAAPLSQGRALIGRLLLALTRAGATVRTGTRVTGLLTDGGGRVVGVEARTAEGPVRVRARRGVLLAAGGFERNAAMRAEHGVPGDAAWSMAPAESAAGEPIAAAVALGAATDLLDQAWFCPGVLHPEGSAAFTLGFRGGLVVDGTGHRYADESLPYDRMGRQMAAAPGRVPSWLVFDSRAGGQLPAISIPPLPPEEHLAAGTWVRADTLAELARQIGVPPAELTGTVERFNTFAATGVDEDFSRGEDPYGRFFAVGDGPNPCLVPVDRAPFYAARLVLSDLGTKGGLCTDPAGRVLRTDGAPIPGLYAAGNTSASMAGPVYPGPGIPIGTAMVFSSLAVQDMTGASLEPGSA
ncbi:FAD-dependent oxidoreductase [Geodermatophilus sp. DF01-2]|uniref:FAD-dependent oxidoreductase n=1 Tax=Geodermatophilus sp. DF01-2 TaxID=2559610 RepID=UPI001073BFE2|nr:FAD-dependent oxidoreductase [Geodermatophilus sp. DF01_2]TFV64298.1 FAD-dependent oxidoreductase [Geodermatophilus sp. DF01_2]